MEPSTSREDLRREMDKMRRRLTVGEQTFLESLIVHGDDVEVQIATKRLNDISIFYPHEDEKHDPALPDDRDCRNSIATEGIKCIDIEDDSPIFGIKPPLVDNSLRLSSNSTMSHGTRRSMKVEQALHSRRTSEVHGKIWKAHENGLAVTSDGSRKSVIRRESNVGLRNSTREQVIRNSSLLSEATQDLILEGGLTKKQGSDSIFRESSNGTIEQQQKTLFNTIDGISPILPKSIMKPLDVPSPVSLAQVRSDGFRKSVSFSQKNDTRQRSESFSKRISPRVPKSTIRREVSDLSLGSTESFAAIQAGNPVRSESLVSFPSLHKAHPLRSDSVATSGSLPSLHRAAPVRSESVTSTADSNESDPAWSSPHVNDDPVGKQLQRPSHPKPMLLRLASRNGYQGEGFEVSELDDEAETVNKARLYASMLSTGDISTATSWDETMNRDNIFRHVRRSLSDDENLASYFLGTASKDSFDHFDYSTGNSHSPFPSESLLNDSVRTTSSSKRDLEVDGGSWEMNSETEEHPDAWDVLKDPYSVGYGANGTLPFRIFGTSADDESAKPHVLSPPLMESLQNFFPYGVSEDNFWMKYSLVRDGASMHSLLQHIRGAKYTIVALETSDGEVFGSFTSEPWRKNWNYFGNGESFLWRMRQPRTTECHSIIDQAHLESELDVYPWTGENNCVQLCTHDNFAVGGGTLTSEKKDETDPDESVSYGFGIAIDRLLLKGTSSHCATFGSPPLSKCHSDGSPFEIMNLEVWTLTPCYSLEDAEKLELGKLFLTSQ